MSVRRLFSLIQGLGYQRAGTSSGVSERRQGETPSASTGLAQLVAMKPKDMAIVYAPKRGEG